MTSTEHWDAGEIGCARLVIELAQRLERIAPGARLEIVARDPGAPVDLPAWCRMTGHELESAEHPVYVIRRRPA
jgi:tRNA 2-thiouridine synthesizing protein A